MKVPALTEPEVSPTPAQTITPPSRRRVWVGIAVAVTLDVPVQLVWKALMLKFASARGPHDLHTQRVIRWFAREVRSWELLVFFLLQFLNWIWVLGNADLSYAQPFTALSFVVVSACAGFYFHEHIGPLRWVGIFLILAGVLLVGATEHRTTPITLKPGPTV